MWFVVLLMTGAVVVAIAGSVLIWGFDMRRAREEAADAERFRLPEPLPAREIDAPPSPAA